MLFMARVNAVCTSQGMWQWHIWRRHWRRRHTNLDRAAEWVAAASCHQSLTFDINSNVKADNNNGFDVCMSFSPLLSLSLLPLFFLHNSQPDLVNFGMMVLCLFFRGGGSQPETDTSVSGENRDHFQENCTEESHRNKRGLFEKHQFRCWPIDCSDSSSPILIRPHELSCPPWKNNPVSGRSAF